MHSPRKNLEFVCCELRGRYCVRHLQLPTVTRQRQQLDWSSLLNMLLVIASPIFDRLVDLERCIGRTSVGPNAPPFIDRPMIISLPSGRMSCSPLCTPFRPDLLTTLYHASSDLTLAISHLSQFLLLFHRPHPGHALTCGEPCALSKQWATQRRSTSLYASADRTFRLLA